MRLFVLPFLVICALQASPFHIRKGDTYDWVRQDLGTVQETALRVTVLDSMGPDTLPSDSGHIWKVGIEPVAAAAETLEIFQFRDGALRWYRDGNSRWQSGAILFPVEFDPPQSASKSWCRGGLYWGMPYAGYYLETTQRGATPAVSYSMSSSGTMTGIECSVSAESLQAWERLMRRSLKKRKIPRHAMSF